MSKLYRILQQLENPFSSWSSACLISMIVLSSAVWAVPTEQTFNRETNFGRLNLDDLKSDDPSLEPEFKDSAQNTKISQESEDNTFVLKSVSIIGATVIPVAVLEDIAKPQIEQKITLQDLFLIAENMTAYYKNAGYILSQVIVPPQNIEEGIVTFEVFEGYVHEISIDQNHLPIKTKILEKYSNSIKQQRPLKLSTLERSILLANDLPGISVKSYLAPSKTTVGAADLTIRVEDRKPYEGFFIYDNKVDKAYGPYQSTLGVVYNCPNLIDKLQFIGRISRHGTLKLAYLNYTHFTEKESYITIETQQVRARPRFEDQRLIPVIGHTQTASLTYFYPIMKQKTKTVLLSSSVDALDSSSRGERNFNDRLFSLRFALEYSFIDRFLGSNTLYLKLSKGLKSLGAAQTNTPNNRPMHSRRKGRSDYTKLNFDLHHLHYLPKQFSILFAAESQWTANRLLAPEEFGFGGYRFGRGYESSSFIGDEGIIAKIEARYDHPFMKQWFQQAQLYLFEDFGYIRDKSRTKLRGRDLTGETAVRQVTTQSGGFGSRLSFTNYLSVQLEIAKPLGAKNLQGNRETRINFSINGIF